MYIQIRLHNINSVGHITLSFREDIDVEYFNHFSFSPAQAKVLFPYESFFGEQKSCELYSNQPFEFFLTWLKNSSFNNGNRFNNKNNNNSHAIIGALQALGFDLDDAQTSSFCFFKMKITPTAKNLYQFIEANLTKLQDQFYTDYLAKKAGADLR